jgi:hypothetical protein
VATVGLFLPSARFFVPAAPPSERAHFLIRALLKFAPMEQNQWLWVGKRDQKRARGDILAADLALYLY